MQEDGQFDTVWETPGLVVGDEWSDYLPNSKTLISDWREPMNCGNFDVATGKCSGFSRAAHDRRILRVTWKRERHLQNACSHLPVMPS